MSTETPRSASLTLSLTRTEDERFLAEEAARIVQENSPVARVRELRDSGDPVGWSRELWSTLAELGWVGLTAPPGVGGSGMDLASGALLAEEAGRRLMPEPLIPTMLATELLRRAGRRGEPLLRRMIQGDAVVAVALDEPGGRWNYARPQTRAERGATGWTLDGAKHQVLEGHVADTLLVTAEVADGFGVFAIDWDTAGMTRSRQTRIDGRGVALVALDGVEVPASARLDLAWGDLRDALDRARILLAAEMLGGAAEAFAVTLAYLKSREQFGVPIGSFQALQHRAARVFMATEMARSAVLAACRTVDGGGSSDLVAEAASLAKSVAGDAFLHATTEGIQMHGGVGVTDEYDIGLYLKRARCAEATWGDRTWHRRRWATLRGY